MYETNFILKLTPHKKEGRNVKSVMAKVKLNKTIHGAKFFELRRFMHSLNTYVIRCDLVDKTSYYFLSGNTKTVERHVQPTDVFLITNIFPYDNNKIKISNSKSTINEFEIEFEFLEQKYHFSERNLEQAFAQLVIHHTEH